MHGMPGDFWDAKIGGESSRNIRETNNKPTWNWTKAFPISSLGQVYSTKPCLLEESYPQVKPTMLAITHFQIKFMSIYRHGGFVLLVFATSTDIFLPDFFGTCSNQCLKISTCAISQNITQCCLTTKVIGGEHHQNLTSQPQKPTSRWFKPWPFDPRSLEVTFSPSQKGHQQNCQL